MAPGGWKRKVESQKPTDGTWRASAINVILGNDIYRGFYIWNRCKYKKVPGTRVYVWRPKGEWKQMELPERRIVDDLLWTRVQKIPGGANKRRRLEMRLANAERGLAGLADAIAASGFTDALRKKQAELEAEHRALTAELAVVTSNGVDLPKLKAALTDGLRTLRENLENLPSLTTRATPQQVERLRTALRSFLLSGSLRQSHLFKKCEPARIRFDAGQQRTLPDSGEKGVPLLKGSLKPQERLVRITAPSVGPRYIKRQ